MSRERLYLFDTTLRDGAQTTGVDFSLDDKRRIARMLDELGRRLYRGRLSRRQSDSTPNFSPRSGRFARRASTAFGMTRRARPLGSNDPGLAALLDAKADAICFVAKSWDYHVRVALETTARRISPRSATACAPPRPRAARCCSIASISSTATRPIRPMRSPAPRRPTKQARAGSCCATPTAARCRTRSSASSARSASTFPATMSASTPITTPSRRWRIRSPRCAPARGKSRARSTGSASAAATPISSRSSRR